MAKETKTELAVIDFTKFSVAQLPELKGKKEEIASIIKANPIVEIVDNATYESAKKSRTAVKTLRTGLQKEQVDVRKRIKEHVLDVVDKEYDTLVLDVKSEEKSRQEPIDVWEEKKEQERQEKARLEELRIKQIKDAIQTFRDEWEDTFNRMTFERISDCEEFFGKTVGEFDRIKLAEFEILFDDAVSFLNKLFESKSTTLTEQEQIRIDNLLIQEKNAENSRIQEWQRTWNANIDTLSFDDLKDVKSILVKSKLADLKHYSAEYEEIYTSTEKRLHSQIELISKAEEQRIAQEKFAKEQAEIAEKNRIAQEKFLAEKKEFEEKQSEAKFQERKKFLVDEDYYRIYFVAECAEEEDVFKSKLLAFSDSEFEDFKSAVLKAKEPVVAIEYVDPRDVLPLGTTDKIDEIANNDVFVNTEEVTYVGTENLSKLFESAVPKTHEFADFKEEQEYIEQVTSLKKEEIFLNENPDMVNWGNIDAIWRKYYTQTHSLIEYLEEFYNVPTKK